jgi:hypothetical protein
VNKETEMPGSMNIQDMNAAARERGFVNARDWAFQLGMQMRDYQRILSVSNTSPFRTGTYDLAVSKAIAVVTVLSRKDLMTQEMYDLSIEKHKYKKFFATDPNRAGWTKERLREHWKLQWLGKLEWWLARHKRVGFDYLNVADRLMSQMESETGDSTSWLHDWEPYEVS